MSTLIVIDLNPKDKEQLNNYSSLAAKTLAPYQGAFIAKGPIQALHGDAEYPIKVVIQFPDKTKALDWYHSKAYQALIPTRELGMNSQFHLIE